MYVYAYIVANSSNPVYKMLATSLEQRSLDIKLACASLLNTLLRAAKDDSQFNLVRQCLTDTHGLLALISGLVHTFIITSHHCYDIHHMIVLSCV